MYNKHQYQVSKDQKVLHKVKKQWITISSVLLMMIGAGAVTTTNISANTSRPVKDQQTYVTNVPSHNRRQTFNNHSDLERIMMNVVHNIHTQKNSVNNISATSAHYVAPNVTNVNRLKMYQSGVYNHNLYTRIKPPFNAVRINHKVALYSLMNFNKAHNYGYLKRGKVARILRAFKGYGANGDYLRYEIPLMHHMAFITGDHHQVSYVVPAYSYRHYQRILNRLLASSNSRKLRPIRKAFKKLSQKRVRSYKAYEKLYVHAYNIRQSLLAKRPIVAKRGRKLKKYVKPSRKSSRQHQVSHTNQNKINSQNNLVDHLENPNNRSTSSSSDSNYINSYAQSVDDSINSVVSSYQTSISNSTSQSMIQSSRASVASSDARSADRIDSIINSCAQSIYNNMVDSYQASMSNSALASQSQSIVRSSQASVASSDARLADNSIVNSYRNSVSNSVSALDQSLARSAASSADQSIKASIANSYARSADNSIVNSYRNSVSNSVSTIDKSLARSAASSADQSIKASIASSYARSADSSIVNSYRNSVSNSVSALDQSLARSAASSADQSIKASIASSYARSADSSIANSYRNSVSNSVSALDQSLARSAASSARSANSNRHSDSIPTSNHSNSTRSHSNSSSNSNNSSQSNHTSHSSNSKSDNHSNPTSLKIGTAITQMKHQTFMDINKERKMYGEKPLAINQDLQGISFLRSQQLMTNFSHFNSNHQLYVDIDAKTLNKPQLVHTIGENIGSASFGLNYEEGTDNRGKRDPVVYNNKNGNDMAYMMNDSMMNWDANSRWGHRANILHNQYKTIGIGVSYDKSDGTFYLAEDFGLN